MRRPVRLAVALGAGAVATVATLVLSGALSDPAGTSPVVASPVPSASFTLSSASPSTAPAPSVSATPVVAAPVRIVVPRLGIDSPLDRLRVGGDGVLQPPPHWLRAAWFTGGPAPGDVGPAVIAGHLDSPSGPAVFAALPGIRPGDEVRVVDESGVTHRFAVRSVRSVTRAAFPTQDVYGPVPDAELRLITCTGPYDRSVGEYEENLVVFATALD